MNEIWKPVKDYEDLYEVSNLGKVKSLGRKVQKFNGHNYSLVTYPEKILKNRKDLKGYCSVVLCKDNKEKNYLVHRLVAEAFIPNPDNKPQINHKSGSKDDNSVSNLEWVTHQENCIHRAKVLKRKCKKILQYDLQGNFIKEWDSISEVNRMLDINKGNIGECCKGNRKTAGGYVWRGLS